MIHLLKATAGMAALSLALGACMSTPEPSSRLLTAEASLMQAKANPTTMQAGRAALEKADVSLREARDYYLDRKDDEYVHAIRMGEGYVALADARGSQANANRKIEELNKERGEIVLAARSRDVAVANAATADAEGRVTEMGIVAADAVADSAASDAARIRAEARLAAMASELESYEQQKTDLGTTLILRDLQFASGSDVLSEGAQGRLAPLAGFLAKQAETRIEILGHTDSQGSEASNTDLSARRAASVGAYLTSTGVDTSRITTSGRGEGSPVATNATAAGRAINRRVEVTILN